MGDSDEEYDRRRGRDKFRRERNDYDNRERRGGGGWDDGRGGRDGWNRDRHDSYQDFGDRRRRFSPQRHDMSPPQMKRMRRDWDDGGGRFSHFDQPYGGGGMHGGGPHGGAGWNDSQPGHFGNSQGVKGGMEPEFPVQPPMMSFKQFLANQEDNITDEESIRRFNEYKLDFKRKQLVEFFDAHKDEEWFKTKYHPEECGKRREDQLQAIQRRRDIFMRLMELGRVECSLDLDRSDEVIKLLDSAVILMEGGREFDLQVLDQQPLSREEKTPSRHRSTSEGQPDQPQSPQNDENPEMNGDAEEGEEVDQEESSRPPKADADESDSPPKPGKKRKKRDYDYEGGSESESGSASSSEEEDGAAGDKEQDEALQAKKEKETANQKAKDEQIAAGGEEDEREEEEAGQAEEPTEEEKPTNAEAPAAEEEEEEEPQRGVEEEGETQEETRPQAYHKTNSIFLRNLAPAITKQEVEAMCRRYPGYLRVAIQDPQPERNFLRRGWVTFDRTVNIKDICWNLNNIRLRDCEMGAIVNRELKQRIRPVNGVASDKQVAKADIKHLAKIVQNFDKRWNLWEDENEEKKDDAKDSLTFGLVSKNPIMPKNITDYLVDEGSYEEEEYLGSLIDEKKEEHAETSIERDEDLLKVIDRMILYLRLVHSFDYYSAVEYPNEDEMPHKCGIMHARGLQPANRLSPNDVSDYITNFETKILPYVNLKDRLDDAEMERMGKKDPEKEVENFILANTQELSKDKWLCPLSGKKFKGPDFVRKHILNKHAEKVDEVRQEVAYYNNYVADPKRPMLPEHPNSRMGLMPPRDGGYQPRGGYQGPPGNRGGMMGGYSRPPMYHHGGSRGGGPYNQHYQNRRPDHYRQHERRDNYPPPMRRERGGRNDRPIIEYRDLDAPDDMDIL